MSCTDEGKRLANQKISNPNYNITEIRNPELVTPETFGLTGDILFPKNYSPKRQFLSCTRSRIPENQCLRNVMNALMTAEKVARRQYDELLLFPEIKGYEKDVVGIRNDEQEHEFILQCILARITGTAPATKGNISIEEYEEAGKLAKKQFYESKKETWLSQSAAQGQSIQLDRQKIRELYSVILDRFAQGESEDIAEYTKLLADVNQGLGNVKEEDGSNVTLVQLHRTISRILAEKKGQLDIINAVKQMVNS
jgi:hypothetical protein